MNSRLKVTYINMKGEQKLPVLTTCGVDPMTHPKLHIHSRDLIIIK